MKEPARKRQKISQDALLDDSAKGEEEIQLEKLLFGKFENVDVDDDTFQVDGSDEMRAMLDKDIFFVDENDDESENSDDDAPEAEPISKSSSSKAVWSDPSQEVSKSVPLTSRTRKLRQNVEEESLPLNEYEKRLRGQFASMNSGTSWADKARARLRAGKDEENDLFSGTGILRRNERSKAVLQSGKLDVTRLRDANIAARDSNCGEIKSLSFHPSPKVPVLAVTSADRRIRLYETSNTGQPPLSTLHLPAFPFTSSPSSPLFHPLGHCMLISSPSKPHWWIWDLMQGRVVKKEANLSAYSDLTVSTNGRKRTVGGGGGGTLNPTFNSDGSLLALSSNNGYVHILDWGRDGGIIDSFKCPGGGAIRSIHCIPRSFEPGLSIGTGEESLAILSSDSTVYIYDLSAQRCVRKWKDEGGYKGSGCISAFGGSLLSIGSTSGYVNVYSASSSLSPDSDAPPKPAKSIGNLTTPISLIRFNHDSQIMAIASKDGGKGSLRFVHTPTLTTYSNFPTTSTPLGIVTALDFSPSGGILAVGDRKGRVGVWGLGAYT